ncbi:MAG: DUF490 domain-containing protein, partial [Paracoccaceae bacterium]
MRRLAKIAIMCLLPSALLAQDAATTEADKGFLTRWLETNLSGAGREVRIEGFAGALSSTASLDKLTIADDKGVWITLEDATLDWDRGALLRGNLDITELSVGSIDLVRWPNTDPTAPSPEATEFKLPELPVAVNIRQVSADSVTLGEAIIGEAAVVSLDGNVSLVEGEGHASLSIARIDDKTGSLTLKSGYSNATKVLDLDVTVQEEDNGILVNLLDIPDKPSLDFKLSGTGQTTDFAAEITLATNSAPRVSGTLRLIAQVSSDGATTNTFQADMVGDVSPLLAEKYREFLGESSELRLSGALLPDKRFKIEEFKLKSAALDLSGTLALSKDGLPEAFEVNGSITAVDGPDVVLPISGPETRISSATIWARFKAGNSDEWSLNANFLGLERDTIKIADGTLQAKGLIQRVGSGETEVRRVTAAIDTELFGVAMSDEALAEAVGDKVTASATIDWQDGGPVTIGFVNVAAGDLEVSGSGTVDGFDTNFRITGELSAAAASLDRFSALTGQPLSGAADIRGQGWLQPLGGAFDGTVEGETTGLQLADSPFLDLVEGDGAFKLVARRDTDGLTIETLTAQAPGISAEVVGVLKTNCSDLRTSVT